MASRTRGGLQPLPPFLFIVATCWFSGLYSFPQAVWGDLGCPTALGPLARLQTECSERTRWDRDVPVKIGDIAVSLQGRGAAG